MSEAPSRIWIDHEITPFRLAGNDLYPDEYIRADLVEAAVKRAIEACAEACDVNHRFGLPKHIQSAEGLLLRKWLSDPEAIAKIIKGEN